MDLGALQLFIIALLPSIGTLITALTVCFSICKKFVELRKEVKDDKTINAILKENKRMNAQYKAALDKLDELSELVYNNFRKQGAVLDTQVSNEHAKIIRNSKTRNSNYE